MEGGRKEDEGKGLDGEWSEVVCAPIQPKEGVGGTAAAAVISALGRVGSVHHRRRRPSFLADCLLLLAVCFPPSSYPLFSYSS
jgi:hypothetical protein